MIKNILNLGDAALYCDFGKDVNKETNIQVIRYFKSIQNENIEGINNLTPSYNKLIISFDLKKTNFKDLKNIIENLTITNINDLKNKKIEIPVCTHDKFSLRYKKIREDFKYKS